MFILITTRSYPDEREYFMPWHSDFKVFSTYVEAEDAAKEFASVLEKEEGISEDESEEYFFITEV